MQARFEYTVDDWREFQGRFQRRIMLLMWPLVAVIACLLLFFLFLMIAPPAPAPTGPGGAPAGAPLTPGSLVGLFLPVLPWMLVFGALFVTLRIIRLRQGPRATMARAPAFQGPMVADVDAAGVTLQSRLYRSQFHWEAVIRFDETKNLFLLFVTPTTAMSLPKRGFASPQELEAMRTMALRLAGHAAPGFPVVPAAAPMPPMPSPSATGPA